MNTKEEMLTDAIGNVNSNYVEEALETRTIKRSAARMRRLSAACIALAVVALCTVTALAVKYWVPSWRDLFGTKQTVIGDEDVSLPQGSTAGDLELSMDINSILSDERVLYMTFTLRSKDGTPLDRSGQFKDYRMYYPDKLMSGGYQYYFLDPSEEAAPGELGGVIYAHWQSDPTVKSAVISFTDWQEPERVDAVKVDINIADTVEKAGTNAKLEPLRHTFGTDDVRTMYEGYLWQPAGGQTMLPGSNGVYIDNLGWEDGMLHIVLRGPCKEAEWLTGGVTEVPKYADPDIWSRSQHWYFVDSRTGEKLYVELNENGFASPVDLGEVDLSEDPDWQYAWQFLKIAKEDLPYLELYCGGENVNVTKWSGTKEISVELPVTMPSEVLARGIPIVFDGEDLTIDRIECSKVSIAVYFPGHIDSTTGIMSAFEAWDKDGKRIDCHWSFVAEQSDRECMVWAIFDEPIEPGNVCTVTYNGQPIFSR